MRHSALCVYVNTYMASIGTLIIVPKICTCCLLVRSHLSLQSDKTIYEAYLEGNVMTMSTLGIMCAPRTSLKQKRKSIMKALRVICELAHYNDARDFEESARLSFSRVENQIQCVLHLHKRIIEKVVAILFTWSLDELTSEVKTKRVNQFDQLQLYINTLALVNYNKPGHWKCPIKYGDEISDASFPDGQAKKVEEKLENIIKKALTLEESRAAECNEVCKRLTWIFRIL
jgi:hypothetical protein